MDVKVNGEARSVEAGTTVTQLLQTMGVDPKTVVVELNLQIPDRESWDTLALADGDSLEVIRLVSGG